MNWRRIAIFAHAIVDIKHQGKSPQLQQIVARRDLYSNNGGTFNVLETGKPCSLCWRKDRTSLKETSCRRRLIVGGLDEHFHSGNGYSRSSAREWVRKLAQCVQELYWAKERWDWFSPTHRRRRAARRNRIGALLRDIVSVKSFEARQFSQFSEVPKGWEKVALRRMKLTSKTPR